jgi:hypothetical protein
MISPACGRRQAPPTKTENGCCALEGRRDHRTVGADQTHPPNRLRTDEDTIDLVRRLAVHYPDAGIAHILNRQNRRTAYGLSFTAGRVQSLRHHHQIACHTPTDDPQEGELPTVADAAKQLRLAPSTLHRWLGDGFISGEQMTPGAPWRIRLTDDIRNLFVDAPDGRLAMLEATSPMASPAKPSCNVSSAANCKPSTSAPDAEKACVSSPHPPQKDCSDHDNQRKPQCDEASKNFWMSKSMTQSVFQHRPRHAATASNADRYGW